MKFKENAIKPGMVIHCPKEEDARALLEHLDHEGYEWFPSGKLMENIRWERYQSGSLYCIDLGGKTVVLNNLYVERPSCATQPTEFSDLIEPDDSPVNSPMTAKELLEFFKKYREIENGILTALFGYDGLDLILDDYTPQDIIDKITAYEAAKKAPKPVEVEWVDVCRIIQIQDNGFKKCVYEEELPDNDGYATTENILKKYISEHEGQYIAVIEGICRVKEDK